MLSHHSYYHKQSSLLLKRRLIRGLGLRRDSGNMASLTIFPVEQGRMGGDTVLPSSVSLTDPNSGERGQGAYIPDDHSSGPPADTALEVLRKGDVVVEELEEEVGFLFLVADDVAGDYLVSIVLLSLKGKVLTLRINIKRLFPGNRMRPNNRMLARNRIPPRNTPPRQTSIHLLNPRMHSPQPMQPLLKLRRQPPICKRHIRKQRVTTACRAIKDVQEGCAGGLLLEGHVRVPGDGVGAGFEELGAVAVVGAAENEVDFREAFGGAGGLVDVVAAEVAAEVEGFIDGEMREVLVAEGWLLVSCGLYGGFSGGRG